MKVNDIMSKHVYTATPNTPLRDIWKLLFDKQKNAVPVIDKDKMVVGIITKEDLLKGLYPNYEEYLEDIPLFENFEKMEDKAKELKNVTAKHFMCKRIVYTRSGTPIMRALSRMIVRRLNQLPVLSDENEIIGMVTKGDIFKALFKKEFLQNSIKPKKKK